MRLGNDEYERGHNHADEYHNLKVQADRPGLTVRTNVGYYDQP